MATKYYIGSGSDWNTDANWSTTSGGSADTTFATSADDAIFDSNSGNCTLDAAAAALSMTLASGYTGTFNAAGYDVTLGTGGMDSSAASSATLDLAGDEGSVWECAGNWNVKGVGTYSDVTATVKLTGTDKTFNCDYSRRTKFEVSGSYTNVNNGAIINGCTIKNGGVLKCGNYSSVFSYGNVTIESGGELADSGDAGATSFYFEVAASSFSVNSGGTLSADYYMKGNTTFTGGGTISGAGEFLTGHGSSSLAVTFAGNPTFDGDVTFDASGTGDYTVTQGTQTLTFEGNVSCTSTGGGSVLWTTGVGATTKFEGSSDVSLDFDGKDIGDVDFTGSGTKTLTSDVTCDTCDITSSGGALTVTDDSGTGDLDVTGALTITGDATYGVTFECDGSCDGASSSATYTTVNGSEMTVGGTDIDATSNCTEGTGTISGWNFGGASFAGSNQIIGNGIF